VQEEANDPVARQFAAYNDRDLTRFLGCYAAQVVIEDATGEVLMRGRDEMEEVYGDLFENSPLLSAKLAARIRVGDYVVDEEIVEGRATSPDVLHAVVIYHVEDDVIDHVRFIR